MCDITNRLKVLQLIDSGGVYGAEKVILNLCSGLKRLGVKSIIGCIKHRGKEMPDIAAVARKTKIDVAVFQVNGRFDLACVGRIARWCHANGISLIHAHGYKASSFSLLVKLVWGIPYLVTCHLWYIDTIRMKFYVFLDRISMYYADRVIGVSEEIGTLLQQTRIRLNKLEVIENGIDVGKYFPLEEIDEARLRNELGLRQGTLLVGSLGRLTEQKDYATFIKASAKVIRSRGDVEFFIAGEGHLRDEHISLCQELGVANKFHFLGFREDVAPLLWIMDVFVLSSLDEGLPIALLEAMSANVPVIATRVGGIPKVIKHKENGILITPQDSEQLADNILLLLNDVNLRKKIQPNALNTVIDRYSIDQMTSRYMASYSEIMRQT